VRQIALALAYLHGQPEAVAHRDVKTENVFALYATGGDASDLARLELKLGDFDSARYMRPADDSESESTSRASGLWRLKRNRRAKRLSMNVGTPEFMAPEMVNSQLADGGSYTEKVDVWSLGMTLFEILTLKIPYRDDGYTRFVVFVFIIVLWRS
jgi:serine/threonine protein kinase